MPRCDAHLDVDVEAGGLAVQAQLLQQLPAAAVDDFQATPPGAAERHPVVRLEHQLVEWLHALHQRLDLQPQNDGGVSLRIVVL